MSDTPRTPLAVERHASIVDILGREGVVRIADLADRLGVTPVTLRRDIIALVEEGIVERVHGGAVLAGGGEIEPPRPTTPPDRAFGMLVPSLDYYWPDVIKGAGQAAAERNIELVLRGSSYQADDVRPQVERLLDHGTVAGLLLAPNMPAEHTAEALTWIVETGIPVVLVERTAAVGPMHTSLESVRSDHAEGASMALRHLADLGHRRVGIATSAASPTSAHVRAGWYQARLELGIGASDDVDVDVPEPSDPAWGAAADDLLDRCREAGTTALLIHADAAAAAITQRCEAQGITVPGDLSIIAYDDEMAGLFTPRLTAVRPPRVSIGRAAVELVSARLADPGRPRHRVVISPSLRIRESTTPPSATGR